MTISEHGIKNDVSKTNRPHGSPTIDYPQTKREKPPGPGSRRIAEYLHISRNTVNSYVQFLTSLERSWQELLEMKEVDFESLFPVQTSHDQVLYEQLCGYFPHYQKELTKPGCTLLTLWHVYQGVHREGYQYTQFVQYFRQWQKRKKVSGKLEHKVGEKVFVDFTGKKLSIVDRNTGPRGAVK